MLFHLLWWFKNDRQIYMPFLRSFKILIGLIKKCKMAYKEIGGLEIVYQEMWNLQQICTFSRLPHDV